MMTALAALVLFVCEARAEAPAKSEVIALIEFENVPLPEAIRNLARQAGINIVIDPRVTAPPLSQQLVSVRWEGVTAREALLAVLENYGLELKER